TSVSNISGLKSVFGPAVSSGPAARAVRSTPSVSMAIVLAFGYLVAINPALIALLPLSRHGRRPRLPGLLDGVEHQDPSARPRLDPFEKRAHGRPGRPPRLNHGDRPLRGKRGPVLGRLLEERQSGLDPACRVTAEGLGPEGDGDRSVRGLHERI